jgi:ATP synthase F1 gamma subunit
VATKSLSKLKTEMTFNGDLTRLVDVMKGISASQYFIMDRKRSQMEKFNTVLEGLFNAWDFRWSEHPFVHLKNQRRLIGVIATDGGFLGGLNMKVIQAAMKHETAGAYYFVVGERGANYLREFNKPHTPFPGVSTDEGRFKLANELVGFILKEVLRESFGSVILVYPHAASFSAQRIEAVNLIPCPFFFKDKPKDVPLESELAKKMILESPAAGIIEYMAAIWLRKRLIEIFEDSKLAEFGARTMHLEGSFQTLTKIDKQLKLQFFKARREKIDQSLRETFTSVLICGKEEK